MFDSAFKESSIDVSLKQKTDFEGIDIRLPKEGFTVIEDEENR
jgi:hypothetical protein